MRNSQQSLSQSSHKKRIILKKLTSKNLETVNKNGDVITNQNSSGQKRKPDISNVQIPSEEDGEEEQDGIASMKSPEEPSKVHKVTLQGLKRKNDKTVNRYISANFMREEPATAYLPQAPVTPGTDEDSNFKSYNDKSYNEKSHNGKSKLAKSLREKSN